MVVDIARPRSKEVLLGVLEESRLTRLEAGLLSSPV